jgi:hypothetical protein
MMHKIPQYHRRSAANTRGTLLTVSDTRSPERGSMFPDRSPVASTFATVLSSESSCTCSHVLFEFHKCACESLVVIKHSAPNEKCRCFSLLTNELNEMS